MDKEKQKALKEEEREKLKAEKEVMNKGKKAWLFNLGALCHWHLLKLDLCMQCMLYNFQALLMRLKTSK